ncbi:MAG: PIN domain-containing protein [Luteolibacter sp.]
MSYSIDANLLLYASDNSSPQHGSAMDFMLSRPEDPDLLCLTWPTLMAYQRIATHPSIFSSPLSPAAAWENIRKLLELPRSRIIAEEEGFADDYAAVSASIVVRGNLVPDAHIATILRQHGVKRIYTADTDFLKFGFLDVVNPLL